MRTMCPAKAIYDKTIIDKKGAKKHIDYTKCAVPFSNNYGCTVCIKECVFFKSNYNKVLRGFKSMP